MSLLTFIVLTMSDPSIPNFQFHDLKSDQYVIINDGVMGGLSKSRLQFKDDTVVYSGFVTTANNGGFASFRMLWPFEEVPTDALLKLKLKGDGNTYQLRLRNDKRFDGVAHSYSFATLKDQWQEIQVTVDQFQPTFRGRKVRGVDSISWNEVQQIGILISSKTDTDFNIILKSMEFMAAESSDL